MQVQTTSQTVACNWRLLSPDIRRQGRLQGFALGLLRGAGLLLVPLLKCNAKGTSCICSIYLEFFLWLFFLFQL